MDKMKEKEKVENTQIPMKIGNMYSVNSDTLSKWEGRGGKKPL